MEYRLKSQYIKAIQQDAILYGKVAHTLRISAPSLVFPLRKNSEKFTQKKVLRLLSEYLGVPENDLIEEVEETETV